MTPTVEGVRCHHDKLLWPEPPRTSPLSTTPLNLGCFSDEVCEREGLESRELGGKVGALGGPPRMQGEDRGYSTQGARHRAHGELESDPELRTSLPEVQDFCLPTSGSHRQRPSPTVGCLQARSAQ